MILSYVPRQICAIENLWLFFDATSLASLFHSLRVCTQLQSMCLIISDSDIAGTNICFEVHDEQHKIQRLKVKHFFIARLRIYSFQPEI